MISVTDKAKSRITELRTEDGHTPDYNIRVMVKGGGCSGLMYDLDFDNQIKESDDVFEDSGVMV
jgi:iron-sulfur cluster assembly protein